MRLTRSIRHLLQAASLLLLAIATPVVAHPAHDGDWAFRDAPSYPGVLAIHVETHRGRIGGTVTTAWYGPIDMQHAVMRGDKLTFDVRNLNDRAHPIRQWTATFTGGSVRLVGDMWHAHVEQTGTRVSRAYAKQHAFRFTSLPPLGTLSPDGLARTPPMGWSSWNKFADHIDDRTIRAIADAMVATGLRDAGYRYVNIDDGWQGARGPDGELRPNARFPDMKALADYVHARGLKLGLYTSPGPKTCAGYEGSYGHVKQDARTFARWGVDYLKYDLCSGEWFYADAEAVKRTYYQMGAALRTTGRPIVYSLCEYGRFDVASWGRSVGGHLWRTTGDIRDDYKTMSDIGFDRNSKFAGGGPGGWNDPDMLEIGNGGMSEDEYRTHMTLWAMAAAPLMMGHDVRTTSAVARRLLENRNVIAVDQDPLGIPGHAVRKDTNGEVWTKPLADGSVAVALFNRGDMPATMSLDPAVADADLTQVQELRDVWSDVILSPTQHSFTVPAHGAVLLKLVGKSVSQKKTSGPH